MAKDESMKDDQDIRLAIQRLARRIRSMQADDDVTEGQRAVLFALAENGPQTLGSLSDPSVCGPFFDRANSTAR